MYHTRDEQRGEKCVKLETRVSSRLWYLVVVFVVMTCKKFDNERRERVCMARAVNKNEYYRKHILHE